MNARGRREYLPLQTMGKKEFFQVQVQEAVFSGRAQERNSG